MSAGRAVPMSGRMGGAMILKRRDRPPFWARVREVLFPRKGLRRPVGYALARLRRLGDSPHTVALGFACGVFVSFSPFLGLHTVLALALAWLLRGNIVAALIGTAVGNPLTFPIIVTVSLQLGWAILGPGDAVVPETMTFGWVFDNLGAVFWPWLVGGVVPGLVAASLGYWLIARAVAAWRAARATRLARAGGSHV